MDEAYIGAIVLFAGNFAPRGWAFCDGSILGIAQNSALFAILGTTYGGNGQSTFALPDLRSRVPVHSNNGQAGPGQQAVPLGQSAGSSSVTLNTNNMPAHTHALQGNTGNGTATSPAGAVPAIVNYTDNDGNTTQYPAYAAAGNTAMGTTGAAGGSLPISVMQPYLGLNYIICLQGIFPSRN